ncbi:MAG: xanthine dehydrogenase accessory protein XdhC [Gammaproteobacteria bacterium]|jgi:xanthine dehydrogenase accessory factor|nr:xanthine dehydrogenase accessory protein XdhC [Gammaproteobacteria bacterium]
MNEWIDELSDLAAAGEPAMLVTVAGVRGSAPREIGAKMIVTATETIGTIGGGQLEYQSTRVAVEMLNDQGSTLRSFPLGSSMGQCCGGVVEILFEPLTDGLPVWLRDLAALHGQREPAIIATRISRTNPAKFVVTGDQIFGADEEDAALVARARRILDGVPTTVRDVQEFFEPVVAPDLNIAVFGAGHVGAAVVNALSELDCNIRWIDSRAKMFRKVPVNVRAIDAPDPALEVAAMPADSFYLVMTHSHAMDFDICDRILRRRDARYCGLIGSLSKRRRFEKRYRQQGMSQAVIDQLVCPIGVDGISGKKPAEIAVSAAAEILKVRERSVAPVVEDYPDNVRPLRS